METIIKKYYLLEGSKLINYNIINDLVDCWFDTKDMRQHRCLSLSDFETIKPQ